jgi:hypothetical protein
LAEIYSCRLEIPVWSKDSDQKASRYSPRLIFVLEAEEPIVVAQVSAWADDLPGRDRWMLSFYPLSNQNLPKQEDEGWRVYGVHARRPRRLDPMLSEGEAARIPRDTAAAAIKVAIEKLAGIVSSRADLVAIEKVADILRPTLERLTQSYLTRFRPRS